jgi:hypothetical protein
MLRGLLGRFRRSPSRVLLACSVLATCGVVLAARPSDSRATELSGRGGPIEPAVCEGCAPPLDYRGGPVAATEASGLIVTPIYWSPPGAQYAFPARYASTIDRFIANVAAASGSTNNVFSVATEYYGREGVVHRPLTYAIRAGAAVRDTGPLPDNGCKPVPGYTNCITDAQLQAAIGHLIHSRRLPAGLQHFYPVFLPPGVETTDSDGTNSVDDYCAYHAAFQSAGTQIVYSDQPYQSGADCSAGQSPNADPVADATIGIFSHELIEVMTDPLTTRRAWDDNSGYEIADMCSSTYGRPLGATDLADPAGTEYNQVINGGKYYLPLEFSNLAYKRFGVGRGCVLSEQVAHSRVAAVTGFLTDSPQTFIVDATPTTLPADGKATSKIIVSASEGNGDGLAGDHVHLTVGVASGSGNCGTVSSNEQPTGRDGRVSVLYTASADDVSCWILASETDGGRAAEAVVYQGDTRNDSPAIQAGFPSTLQSGAAPVTFSMTIANRSGQRATDLLPHLVAFADRRQSMGVSARQLHVEYSTKGAGGPFISVPLVGSTRTGGTIQGYVGPLSGTTVPARSVETITLRVKLDGDVPLSSTSPLFVFQAFLEQTDPADGSDSSLADTDRTPVVVASASGSHTLRDVGLGILVVLVAIAVGGLVVRRLAALGTPT